MTFSVSGKARGPVPPLTSAEPAHLARSCLHFISTSTGGARSLARSLNEGSSVISNRCIPITSVELGIYPFSGSRVRTNPSL